jgi:hypothetical protein
MRATQDLNLRYLLFTWIFFYLGARLFFNLRGLSYDGNRIISTWMQFPDVRLLTWHEIPNIALNFHSSAPGLPILASVYRTLTAVHWELLSQIITYIVGLMAGIHLLTTWKRVKIKGCKFILITLVFFVALNPAMILFDNQFYSTSFVAYSLIFIFSASLDYKKRYVNFTVCFLIAFISFIRPTLPVYLITPVMFYVIIKKMNNRVEKILSITLVIIPLLVCQVHRTFEFGTFSFSSSSSTGVLQGIGFNNLKGNEQNRAGYYPYQIRNGSLAEVDGNNPILNEPLKENGLPNWNYDGYLADFKNDQKNLIPYILGNINLLPHFFLVGMRWAAIEPSCSRVFTHENYDVLRIYNQVYSKIFFLEAGPTLKNSEIPFCNNKSEVQYLYFLLLLAFVILLGISWLPINRRKMQELFILKLSIFLTSSNILFSYTNGSPEMSKYRMETEPVMAFTIIFLLFTRTFSHKKNLRRP